MIRHDNNNKMPIIRLTSQLTLFLIMAFLMAACDNKRDIPLEKAPPSQPEPQTAGELSALSEGALPKLQSAIQDFCQKEQTLTTSISEFKNKPNSATHEAAKLAWEVSHQSLMSFKVLQYLPISHPVLDHLPVGISDSGVDDPNSNTDKLIEHSIWSRLDQTPLFGGYLDYVSQYPYSGITNSDLVISEKLLVKEFQFADEMYVTLGLHAIEFLLWGENGSRSVKDYSNHNNTEDTRIIRRSALLATIANQLHTDTTLLCQSWQSIPLHYLQQLRQYSANQQLEIWLEAVKGAITQVIAPSLAEQQHSPFSMHDRKDTALIAASFNHLLNNEHIQVPQEDSEGLLIQLTKSLETYEQTLEKLIQQGATQTDSDQAEKEGQDIVNLIDLIIDKI